jgi:hypothetical protein
LIEILGQEGSSEFEAALSIRDALCALWPQVETSGENEDDVKLIAGAKISGYRVSDIDIVMCAKFRPGRRFIPKKALRDGDGNRVINRPLDVPNLMVAIEVKDHSAAGVRYVGDNIEVKYSRLGPIKWHSATAQNIDQVHALREYFSDRNVDLYIHRLVILRGVDQVMCHGAVPRHFSGAQLLTEIAATARVAKSGKRYVLRSASSSTVERALGAPLFRRMVPSSLDRKRMDRIATRTGPAGEWQSMLGTKMLRFRGRGGAGKTIMLLQMAWQAANLRSARTLFLTYNLALAADVRRLMALLGIPATVEAGGIAVSTVISFMLSWFSALRLIEEPYEDHLLEKYGELCATALAMLQAGAIGSADIDAAKEAAPDRFDFDYVIVDEAQDWPETEIETLKKLYEPRQFCLADGIDQHVRGQRADWDAGVAKQDRVVIPLRRCLRMKANLAVFANTLAGHVGLNWHVEPNDEAAGGRIILIQGSYSGDWNLHLELLSEAKNAGNAEIDFLFCVPPANVRSEPDGRSSALARALKEHGYPVWDATDEKERRDFPRSIDTYRVVQYSSCRGLEGWTVIAEGLDQFWEYRRAEYMRTGPPHGQSAAFKDLSELATDDAWRWCLIPLTRPIDTLVVCLSDLASDHSRAILEIASKLPDIVERIDN